MLNICLILLIFFSEYIVSYPITNKIWKKIANKLENFFKKYGVPNQIDPDNGSEFTNKDVSKVLQKIILSVQPNLIASIPKVL